MFRQSFTRAIRNWTGFASLLLLLGCGGAQNAPVQAAAAPAPAPVVQPPAAVTRILVMGQSISANCNDFKYGPIANVFQIALNGEEKPAADPFEWANCDKGSMWVPLGRKLIENGVSAKVVFMPIGVGGSKVQDWQPGGLAYPKLTDAIALIKRQGLVFDFAIWHQGSSDNGTPKAEYLDRLSSVVRNVNANVTIGKWLIGVHSRCWGLYDTNIEAAQLEFGNAPEQGRYVGANSNLLGDDYRVDTCHLNQKGQEAMAGLWLESIQRATGRK